MFQVSGTSHFDWKSYSGVWRQFLDINHQVTDSGAISYYYTWNSIDHSYSVSKTGQNKTIHSVGIPSENPKPIIHCDKIPDEYIYYTDYKRYSIVHNADFSNIRLLIREVYITGAGYLDLIHMVNSKLNAISSIYVNPGFKIKTFVDSKEKYLQLKSHYTKETK